MTFKTTLFVLFLFFYSFVLFMCLIFDWHPVWSHTGLNFTANTFPFGDIQSITNYLESKNSGLNPRTDNYVTDNGQIIPKFNYPLIWSYLSNIGLKGHHSFFFGTLLFTFFSFGVFKSLKVETINQFFVYLFLLVSPVTALLIERGNNDQLVFFLIVMFSIFLNKNNFLAIVTFYSAFLVKLFPAIIIFTFVNKNFRPNLKLITLLSLPIIFYIFFTFPEVIEIRNATPISSPMVGYGWLTHSSILGKYLNGDLVYVLSIFFVLLIFLFPL